MSNWWKRIFGLEDDDAGESRFPTNELSREDGRRKSQGRFEDPNRQIDVKVLHQYPNQSPFNQKTSQTPLYPRTEQLRELKGGHETRSKRNEWDESPAYVRRPMREDSLPPFERKADNKRDGTEASKKKKQVQPVRRARFSPTTVASPVYGYRERPISQSGRKPPVIERNSVTPNQATPISSPSSYGLPQEHPKRHIQEKQPYAEQKEAWTPQLTDTLSRYDKLIEKVSVKSQLESRETIDPSFSQREEDQSSRLIQISEEEPSPIIQVSEEEPSRLIQVSEEEPSRLIQVSEEEPSRLIQVSKEEQSPIIQVSEEEQSPIIRINDEQENHNESGLVDEGEDIQAVSPTNGELSIRRERNSLPETPRKSAIPYNVMMTRSDHLANRTRDWPPKKMTERGPEKQNEFSTENQTVTPPSRRLSLELLNTAPAPVSENDLDWIEQKKAELSESLGNFNVKADVISHVQGPTVTRFEIRLHPGVKVNKVIGLTEDLKLTLSAKQIRIAPVPGKNTVGIEIPNQTRKPVFLRSLLQSTAYQEASSPLTAVLGQDITGQHVVTDLGKMPHGLIAGATGSGKSVCIHSLILSLIYKASPDELRLILIDPKVVELATYREMPHLAAPVITQPREAALALKWAVNEMERRYQLFADTGVRDLSRYNEMIQDGKVQGEKIPYIVIIIDELADLMMTSPQDVEAAICRIAQKARAAGIHMLLATQRPSVDVITGLIKSNIPTRIAFGVSAQTDSRTILDMSGAERLLGQGDMLFSENGSRSLRRLQGTFVTDEEIERITDTFHQLEGPEYLFDVSDLQEKQAWDEEEDELFEEAGYFVIEQGQASVSSLQRRFRIGYNRAARLVDQLEAAAIISEANGSKPRQVLVDKGAFEHAYVNGE